MRTLLVCILLTGCAASFQIGQTKADVTRAEIAEALQQRDRAIAELTKQLKPILDSWVKK